MIKANELMVGNYIYNDNYPCVVTSIDDENNIETEVNFQGFVDGLYQPIPLTEDILLKCGFNQWGSYKNLWKDNIDKGRAITLRSNALGKDMHGCYFELSNNHNVGIKHLHQLQNLYRALTNKELEIKL